MVKQWEEEKGFEESGVSSLPQRRFQEIISRKYKWSFILNFGDYSRIVLQVLVLVKRRHSVLHLSIPGRLYGEKIIACGGISLQFKILSFKNYSRIV